MAEASRRAFLMAAGLAAGGGLGLLLRAARGDPSAADCIRPPGATSEEHFLAACLRCGQCVQRCPADTLTLAFDIRAWGGNGAPVAADLATRPCTLCSGLDDLQCIAACPTSALQPVQSIRDIDMGLAHIDESICLPYNGVTCRTCWHACPLPNEALRFNAMLRPVVHEEDCIGCGLCEHACPTSPKSIVVTPPGTTADGGHGPAGAST